MTKLTHKERMFIKKYKRNPEKFERRYQEAMTGLANFEAEMRKDPEMARQLDDLIVRHKKSAGDR